MSTRVPEEFIKSLQGKKFVLLGGLLELAHQDGLSFTHTEVLQFPSEANGHTTVVRAIVRTKKGEFSGIGDANATNVPSKNIAVHSIRMAETRALARALRVATNVGMTAFEELGADIDTPASKPEPKQTPKSEPVPLAQTIDLAGIRAAATKAGLDSAQLLGLIVMKWGEKATLNSLNAEQAIYLKNWLNQAAEKGIPTETLKKINARLVQASA